MLSCELFYGTSFYLSRRRFLIDAATFICCAIHCAVDLRCVVVAREGNVFTIRGLGLRKDGDFSDSDPVWSCIDIFLIFIIKFN